MKEFYLLVGDKLNTRMWLVVLECLKDCAFHIKTVYVNSLDPSRGCNRSGLPLQAEATALQWDSVVPGESRFIMPLAWSVVQCLQRFVQPTSTIWKFLDFSIICSLLTYFHRM